MKPARRPCASALALGVSMLSLTPLWASRWTPNVTGTLTPELGLDTSTGRLIAAARADLVLEDRWLVGRRGTILRQMAPDEARPTEGYAPRVSVSLPATYAVRTADGHALRLVLTGSYTMGFAGQPTYTAVAAAWGRDTAGEQVPAATPRGLALPPNSGLPREASIELPLRPDAFALLPDGTGFVYDALHSRLARVRLNDGTLIADLETSGGLTAALLYQPATGLLYRFDTVGGVERFRAETGQALGRTELPAPGDLELSEVRAAVLDPASRRVVAIGRDCLWAVEPDGSATGPVGVDERLGELSGRGLGLRGRTLWLLAGPDAEHPPVAVPVNLDTLNAGAAQPLLTLGEDDHARGFTFAVAADSGSFLVGAASADGALLGEVRPDGDAFVRRVAGFQDSPSVTLSPDGRMVALWRPGREGRVLLRPTAGLKELEAVSPSSARAVDVAGPAWVQFTPDGRSALIGDAEAATLRIVALRPAEGTGQAVAMAAR